MVATIELVSPRHIVQRKAIKDIARAFVSPSTAPDDTASEDASAEDVSSADPPLPRPGDMQLYSFYTPSLEADTYTITSKQQVWETNPRKTVDSPPNPDHSKPDPPPKIVPPDAELIGPCVQQFEVVAPQFTIDPKDIHSCYPPQGHTDQAYVLPHIVFNDPHLPWERRADTEKKADFQQNRVPWIALLNFDPNGPERELRVDLTKLKTILPVDLTNQLLTGAHLQKSNSLAVTMTVEQYLALGKVSGVLLPNYTNVHNRDKAKLVDVVFLNQKQFNAFFTSTTDHSKIDVSRYRLLSHVRNINTVGMPQSGVEDQGLFSITVSHRSGPSDIDAGSAPRTQIVHLLSIENVSSMPKLPGATDLVAMITLASWSYQCLPPLGVNFVDAMYDIGMQLKSGESCLLRPSDKVLAGMMKDLILEPEGRNDVPNGGDTKAAASLEDARLSEVKQRNVRRKMTVSVHQRMLLGYSLIRQRLANGEETIAFTRGPLTPVQTSKIDNAYAVHPLGKGWPRSSNTGQDYQLLDQDLGIMDISYSTAWQLGKAMAVADTSFTAPLMRVRGLVHSQAANSVKTEKAAASGFKSTAQFLVSLPSAIDSISAMASNGHESTGLDPTRRWQLPSQVVGTRAAVNDSVPNKGQDGSVFRSSIKSTLTSHGSLLGDTEKPFNELSAPTSTDWALIHKWVMDKLYLSGIPHHYYLTDPTHLPPETIRFFHVDQTWFDCFLDGAFSVANHLSRSDDDVRRGIKEQLNAYFSSEVHEGALDHYPQIPTYGFLLRSKVVECFPDLRIEVPFVDEKTAKTRASILSLRLLGKDILLCLLDRLPDNGELKQIRMSQPEHQQCFSVGDYLDSKYVEFKFRKVPPAPKGNVPTPADPVFGHSLTTVAAAAAAVNAKFNAPENGFDQFVAFSYPADQGKSTQPNPITGTYSWETRCLNLDSGDQSYSAELMKRLIQDPNWKDGVATSALIGLELNLPVYYLLFWPPKLTNPTPAPAPDPKGSQRVIWIGPQSNDANTSKMSTDSSTKSTDASKGTQGPSAASSAGPKASTPLASKTALESFVAARVAALVASAPVSTTSSLPDPATTIPASTNPLAPTQTWFDVSPWGSLTPIVTAPPGNLPQITNLQYLYRIYPSSFRQDINKAVNLQQVVGFVPLTAPYDYDLIVSIRRQQSDPRKLVRELANASLFELMVRIPIPGTVAASDASGQPITPLIDTKGLRNARMISNQRWVVRVDLEPGWIACRLIPRSSRWSSPLRDNLDLSFRLNGVATILGAKKSTSPIKISETYRKNTAKTDKTVTWEKQGGGDNNGRTRVQSMDWKPEDGW